MICQRIILHTWCLHLSYKCTIQLWFIDTPLMGLFSDNWYSNNDVLIPLQLNGMLLCLLLSPVKDTVVTNDRWCDNGCACHHGGVFTCNDRYNPGEWHHVTCFWQATWGKTVHSPLFSLIFIRVLKMQMESWQSRITMPVRNGRLNGVRGGDQTILHLASFAFLPALLHVCFVLTSLAFSFACIEK